MIIHFDQDAGYYAQQSLKAEGQGRLYEALRYADKAKTLCPSFANQFRYASLLNDMECYLESSVALFEMRRHPLTDEQMREWTRLIADNASEQNALPAVVHYNQEYLKLASSEEAQEMLSEYLSRWDEGESRKLQFSDKIHDEDNRTLYREAVEAYEAGDYKRAVLLTMDMQEGYALHKEGLFVRGMSRASLGDDEGAVKDLTTMFEISHDPRVLYHLDEVARIDDDVLASLLPLSQLEECEDFLVAASLASRHHLDELALDYMDGAMDIQPFDAFVMAGYAAALLNLDKTEDAMQILREAKELHPFLPTCLLSAPAMRLTVAKGDLPPEWEDWMFALVKDEVAQQGIERALLGASTREIIRYLLCYGEDKIVLWLSEVLSSKVTFETIQLTREVLLFPRLNPLVTHRLLGMLLTEVRRGRVAVCSHYIYETFTLKVPPSLDDMDPILTAAFRNAFFEMAFSLKHNELKLTRLVEKLYLNPPPWEYRPEVMGTAMWTVVCLGKRESQNLGSLLDARGIDPTQFALAVSYLKSITE